MLDNTPLSHGARLRAIMDLAWCAEVASSLRHTYVNALQPEDLCQSCFGKGQFKDRVGGLPRSGLSYGNGTQSFETCRACSGYGVPA